MKEKKTNFNKDLFRITGAFKCNSKNRGITLIALVITIVILLILAAVSIKAVLGDNGIVNKAKDAKVQYNNADSNEKAGMGNLVSTIESIEQKYNGTSSTPAYIDEIGKTVLDGNYYECIPDNLTSSTSQSYVTISCSTALYSDKSACYRAFQNEDYCGWGSSYENNPWLQVCFNTQNAPIINRLTFRGQVLGNNVGSNSGDHWEMQTLTFKGSNDGITWTNLKTINVNESTVDEQIENTTGYKYYLFYSDTAGYKGLSNIHMYTSN